MYGETLLHMVKYPAVLTAISMYLASIQILHTLEGLSYICTVGLLAAAIFGLKQITVSKQQLRINAKRDSYALANQQIKYYLETVIPLVNRLDKLVDDNKVGFFENLTVGIQDSTSLVVHRKSKNNIGRDQQLKELDLVVGPLTQLLNAIESFSTYFTCQLADESIAFKSVGRTFCGTVEHYMPAVITPNDTTYQNIAELYLVWKPRLEAQSLKNKKEMIEKQLEKMGDKSIIPIGTADLD